MFLQISISDLAGWLRTSLIERISQDQRRRTCAEAVCLAWSTAAIGEGPFGWAWSGGDFGCVLGVALSELHVRDCDKMGMTCHKLAKKAQKPCVRSGSNRRAYLKRLPQSIAGNEQCGF